MRGEIGQEKKFILKRISVFKTDCVYSKHVSIFQILTNSKPITFFDENLLFNWLMQAMASCKCQNCPDLLNIDWKTTMERSFIYPKAD